jgi:hypothetical protein
MTREVIVKWLEMYEAHIIEVETEMKMELLLYFPMKNLETEPRHLTFESKPRLSTEMKKSTLFMYYVLTEPKSVNGLSWTVSRHLFLRLVNSAWMLSMQCP